MKKKVNGIIFKQREVVLVPFPYSDMTSTKKRPVLIVSNDDYNHNHKDVIVCVITSIAHNDKYSIQLKEINLEYGLLPEDSIIKVHKLFTIDKSKIIKKFSVINKDYYNQVNKILVDLFK